MVERSYGGLFAVTSPFGLEQLPQLEHRRPAHFVSPRARLSASPAARWDSRHAVKEAFNDLLIEEEDYKTLRDSIDTNDAFDAMGLAARLEKHDLLEFRRLASHLYGKAAKWDRSISLAKEDKLFKDAITTAAVSNSTDVAEELLRYFSDIGSRECFVALLFAAFDLIRPDVAEELSWRHSFHDTYMPYRLQVERSRADQIASLAKKLEELSSKTVAKEEEENSQPMLGLMPQTLALGYY
ncbi:hypothetical protein RTBOTA2_002945 [Rhodotorula toruloides]|nr:hypothetical protein RTBOTA2_002945 [Rhodotorula toruloides]